MKKLLSVGIMAAAIAGFSTMTKAAPISDMDLDISGLGQVIYSWSEATGANDGLDLARLRLKLAAKPADKVSFKVQIEETNNVSGGNGAFGSNAMVPMDTDDDGVMDGVYNGDNAAANNTRLVEMYVDLSYLDWMTARIGQFALPNSYELNTCEYDLETINYSMGVGTFGKRDRGIMVFGKPIPEFGWSLWGINGDGGITGANSNSDDQAAYGLQFDWIPLKDLSFKIWGEFDNSEIAVPAFGITNDGSVTLGIGMDYKYAGFHFSTEYNDANVDILGGGDYDITEWLVTASYKIPETNLQLVARYNDLQLDAAGNTNAVIDSSIVTAGLNWNFEKNARLQIMKEFVDGSDNDNFDVMLSVRF